MKTLRYCLSPLKAPQRPRLVFTVPGGAAGSGWGLGVGLGIIREGASWDLLSKTSNFSAAAAGAWVLHASAKPGEGQMTTESSSNSTASLFKQGCRLRRKVRL